MRQQWLHIWQHSSSSMFKRFATRFDRIFYAEIILFLFTFYFNFLDADIRVLHEGGCTLHETYRALGRNAHNKACSSPRRTIESNSICTTSNQTYSNPFMAICSVGGSMHVREKVGGTCGCPVQRSCERVRKIQESLKTATLSERTKFLVCGSDLRTYRSEHHLECSRPYNRCKF